MLFLFSYACILIGQGFIYRYIFMTMYSFIPPLYKAKFYGVLSCVFDNSGSGAGEKVCETLLWRMCLTPDF
jgi:hypothetical protein